MNDNGKSSHRVERKVFVIHWIDNEIRGEKQE